MKTPRKAKPRVWLPYQGPPLVELLVETVVPALPRTTTKLAERCEHCGAELFDLVGVEEKSERWNARQQKLMPYHRPWKPGKGLFVAKKIVGGVAFLRSTPFSEAILCTDEARDFLVGQHFTNVDFAQVGALL